MVLVGPGGVGKGTIARELVRRDDRLWLSRSWTTRAQRPDEDDGAYHFVDNDTFVEAVNADGFFEWAEFLGNYYGTPLPSPPDGHDVLLEIDVQGAAQVLARRPDATVIALVPPSEDVQIERLRGRGDEETHVLARVEAGRAELEQARTLASHVVINDQLDQAVAEVASILEGLRRSRGQMIDEQ